MVRSFPRICLQQHGSSVLKHCLYGESLVPKASDPELRILPTADGVMVSPEKAGPGMVLPIAFKEASPSTLASAPFTPEPPPVRLAVVVLGEVRSMRFYRDFIAVLTLEFSV